MCRLTPSALIFMLSCISSTEPRPKTPKNQPHSLDNNFEAVPKKENEYEFGSDSKFHGFIDSMDSHRAFTPSKNVPLTGSVIGMVNKNNDSLEIFRGSLRENETSISVDPHSHRPLMPRSHIHRHRYKKLNITITVLTKDEALLHWWPKDALVDKDFEVVFMPEHASYKIVIGVSDPVGNELELRDLKPYTNYQLEVRSRFGNKENWGSVEFSTGTMDSTKKMLYRPPGIAQPVRTEEVVVVVIVLLVWALCVYIFFHQWGKIRGPIPYQPAYTKPETPEEEIINYDPNLNYDPRLHQARTRRQVAGWQLAPFHLLQSTIHPKLSIIDEEKDLNVKLMGLTPDDQCIMEANDDILNMYQRAMTFDELVALDMKGNCPSGGPQGYQYGRGFGPMFGKRNNSAWALAGSANNPDEAWGRLNQSMRKVKSAENLSNPRIIVNRTFDDEDQKEGAFEKFEFDENLLSSISQAAGINDSTSDPVIEQEKLFRSTSFRSTTPSRYNNHSLDIDHPSFESNMATGDDYYHTSIDGYNQEVRRRKHIVWHTPNMARRSSSRNSEPPYMSPSTLAGRPPVALRSLSLRMAPHEKAFGVLDPPPPSPTAETTRHGSATMLSIERPSQTSLLPISSTLSNQAVPSRCHSPTQQPNTCLTPSVTVVTPSLNQDGVTSNTLAPIIQPNPVFQSKPSTLAVPNLVGKTQAVSASKRAFLQSIRRRRINTANTTSMPPAIPGSGPMQMIPSGSSNNLYTMNSPTDINQHPGEEQVLSQQTSMMPSVNPFGVPYVAGATPAAPRYTFTRRPKLPRDDIESSIPQTMQLFNRMNKKAPSTVNPSSGGRGPSNRFLMQQQNQGGNESSYQNKKFNRWKDVVTKAKETHHIDPQANQAKKWLEVISKAKMSSLQHNSSDSEQSIRHLPHPFFGYTQAQPSFTAMPIIGAPRGQILANTQAQHNFNAYDHQRVGSFRSRLKKQHPIQGSDNSENTSTNLFVPVDVERINQRDVSTSSTSQHYAGMTLSTSPTNEHNTSLRKDNTKEVSNIALQQTPAGKNMVVSLTSSYTANNSQVQSFVAVEENAPYSHNPDNQPANNSNINETFESKILNGNSKKPKSHKKFWKIGGSGSSSHSGGSVKSNSFHSSKGSNANSSKESRSLDKESANNSRYLSVTYKSQD